MSAGGVLHTMLMPGTSPNERQVMMAARKYGMFMHYGINTFNNLEWSDGTLPVSSYNPTAIDPAQWVSTARAAGMTYVLAISKHHDGFTLWSSSDTAYGIGTPGVGDSTDVIAGLAAACAADEAANPGTGVKL